MFGLCEAKIGTEVNEVLQAGDHGMMSKRIQVLEDCRARAKEARNWKIEGQKKTESRGKNIRGFE